MKLDLQYNQKLQDVLVNPKTIVIGVDGREDIVTVIGVRYAGET